MASLMGSQNVFIEEYDKSFIEEPQQTYPIKQQFIITAQRGRLNTPTLIKTQNDFLSEFGYPDSISQLTQFVTVNKFPQWVVRIQRNQTFQNALISQEEDNSGNIQYVITNQDDVTEEEYQFSQSLFIRQKDPGKWGNDIRITLKQVQDPQINVPLFDLVVFYKNAKVEEFRFSFENVFDDVTGQSLFVNDVLASSNYIRLFFDPERLIIDQEMNLNLLLQGGNEDPIDNDNIDPQVVQLFNNVVDIFKENEEIYDFDYVVSQGWTHPDIMQQLISLQTATKRVQLLDQPDKSVDEVLAMRNFQQFDTSYAQMFYPFLLTYHPLSQKSQRKKIIKVPPTFFVQSKFMEIDSTYGQHFQVAGFTRGEIQQVGLQRPISKTDRDKLYNAGINPIIITNNKVVIWGNKTLQILPSKLNRISSRRLVSLQVIKKLKQQLKQFLFRPYNLETLRDLNFVMNQFIESLRQNGSVEDVNFKIISTPELRDRNSIIIELNLIPTSQLEYITVRINILSSTQITVTEG